MLQGCISVKVIANSTIGAHFVNALKADNRNMFAKFKKMFQIYKALDCIDMVSYTTLNVMVLIPCVSAGFFLSSDTSY